MGGVKNRCERFNLDMKKPQVNRLLGAMSLEERVGFEPTVPYGTPDFESGTFGHSATSPHYLVFYQAGDTCKTVMPPIYGCKAAGTWTVPSSH